MEGGIILFVVIPAIILFDLHFLFVLEILFLIEINGNSFKQFDSILYLAFSLLEHFLKLSQSQMYLLQLLEFVNVVVIMGVGSLFFPVLHELVEGNGVYEVFAAIFLFFYHRILIILLKNNLKNSAFCKQFHQSVGSGE